MKIQQKYSETIIRRKEITIVNRKQENNDILNTTQKTKD